jgi:twinkle protein
VAKSKAKAEFPESELVQKGLPCDDCGSSDALALYTDEHTHCFSCGVTKGSNAPVLDGLRDDRTGDEQGPLGATIQTGSIHALKSRGITQATCREWDYRIRQNPHGEFEQLAVYRDEHGTPAGVKVRNVGVDGTAKEFHWVGSAKGQLYGRHKWSAGGKILTIVEGEIDALTVSQCYAHKYPVVSVPNGAHEAAKAFAKNLEFIASFDKVVIGFDMDAQGRDAAVECAKLLPPGKAFIVKWAGGKDANEMLQAGKPEEITRCCWNAEAYRPDGVIDARQLTAQCLDPVETGIPWPWDFMTGWTYGRRPQELYVIGAGTGIGKTDMVAEVIASTISGLTKSGRAYPPEGFAIFAYEAGAATTKKAIAGKLASRRFHIPQDDSGASWTDDELRAAMDLMDHALWDRGGKLFINDSRGAADWDAVVERARYLHHAEGITNFLVDPISALVTDEENERQFIDKLVLQAAKLSVELNSKIYLASHLARPKDGPSHEEGGHVRLSQFRGSNAIGMFANFVFGMERNQQAEEESERALATIRVVKDRFTGNSIGKTSKIVYDAITGSYDSPSPSFIGDVE